MHVKNNKITLRVCVQSFVAIVPIVSEIGCPQTEGHSRTRTGGEDIVSAMPFGLADTRPHITVHTYIRTVRTYIQTDRHTDRQTDILHKTKAEKENRP